MVFTVTEKQIKERDGAAYDLDKYVLGTDYVVRRAFKGERRMFRKGILDLNGPHSELSQPQVDLSPVISQQEPDIVEHDEQVAELSADIPGQVGKFTDMVEPVVTRPANLDGSVRSARVVKKHQNQRWVETDTLGRVFVGEKGHQIKLTQLIQVRDGVLYLPSRT